MMVTTAPVTVQAPVAVKATGTPELADAVSSNASSPYTLSGSWSKVIDRLTS